MPTIILVNGAPRAGKDTIGAIIGQKARGKVYVTKFAKALKERTHALYGFSGSPHDAWEMSKDEPTPDFLGLTPRQAYIAVAERLLRPVHGARIFGQLLLQDIDRNGSDADVIVITDSGFAEESMTLIERFGADSVVLIRVHRPGCDFQGDSRSLIGLEGVLTFDVTNCQSLEQLGDAVGFVLVECGLIKTKAQCRADSLGAA